MAENRKKTGVLIALTLPVLCGCSLINPYIDVPQPMTFVSTGTADHTGGGQVDVRFHGDLPRAIDEANRLRNAYYSAVGDATKLKNGLALSLIPLGAGALLDANISRSHNDFVPIATYASAAGLGVGTFLLSSPRQAVYLSGSQSLGCAVLAMRPYLFTEQDYGDFETKARWLDRSLGQLDSDLASIAGLNPTNAELAQINAIKVLRDSATATRSDVVALNADIANAPLVLHTQVLNIRDAVGDQVRATEPQLDEITNIVKAMKPTSTTPSTSVVGSTGVLNGLSNAAGNPTSLQMNSILRDAQIVVAAQTAASAYLDRVKALAAKSSSDVSACLPKSVNLGVVLSVDSITLNAGDSYRVHVSGGTGAPRPKAIGPHSTDLDVSFDGADTITIAAKSTAAPGPHQVLVTDSTGQNGSTIAVAIQAGAAVQPPPKQQQPPAAVNHNAPVANGAKKPPPKQKAPPPPVVTGATTPAEKALDAAKVKLLQQKIGAPQSGVFDAATRVKIQVYEKSNNLSRKDGYLGPDIVTKLGLGS